jgi:murein DD-endopeptidase MepM/ murein hydrolase activator NlpD
MAKRIILALLPALFIFTIPKTGQALKKRSMPEYQKRQLDLKDYSLDLYSRRFSQGNVMLAMVSPPKDSRIKKIKLTFQGKHYTLDMLQGQREQVYIGLLGISPKKKAGPTPLVMQAWNQGGSKIKATTRLKIAKEKFPSKRIRLRVNKKYTGKPNKKLLAKIRKQKKKLYAAFRTDSKRLWQGSFVDSRDLAPITSPFYKKRYYNNSTRPSIHRGVDLQGRWGDPVRAINSGEVVLSSKMFYEGNVILINHGHKTFSLYMHLQKRKVDKGDKVQKGQIIGYVGATGVSTGPHLDIRFYIQGQVYSPLSLLALPIPENGT